MDVTGGHLESPWGPLGWLRGGPHLWEMKDPREGAWHFASRGWYGLWGSGEEDSFSDLDPMGQRWGRSF